MLGLSHSGLPKEPDDGAMPDSLRVRSTSWASRFLPRPSKAESQATGRCEIEQLRSSRYVGRTNRLFWVNFQRGSTPFMAIRVGLAQHGRFHFIGRQKPCVGSTPDMLDGNKRPSSSHQKRNDVAVALTGYAVSAFVQRPGPRLMF